MNIDWSKAPEWANAVVAASTGALYFVEAFGVRSKRRAVSNSDDCSRAADMTIKSYSWKLIEERPKKQEAWYGEGLPPVNCFCETLDDDADCWVKVEIYAHTEFMGETHACAKNGTDMFYGLAHEFRPIKTAEQLAAEEKVAAIAEMRAVLMAASDRKSVTLVECLATVALYEAGYRKQ